MLLSLLCALVWLSVASAAAPVTVKVGIYDNAPKVFIDETGQAAGFFVEILTAIAEMEGWTLAWVPCYWQECLHRLEAAELDLMVDVAYSPERDQYLDFNREVVLYSWSRLYARPDHPFRSILDLHEQRIAVMKGSIQAEALQEQAAQFGVKPDFHFAADFSTLFDLLVEGRVDGAVANRFFGAQMMQRYELSRTPILIRPVQVYFAAPQGQHADLLGALDRRLQAMQRAANSPYQQAEARWITPLIDSPYRVDWAMVRQHTAIASLLMLGLIIALMVFWNRRLRQEIYHREATQQALSESEGRLRLLAENMGDLVCLHDPDGRLSYVSPSVQALLGFQPQALLGSYLKDYCHPADQYQFQSGAPHSALLYRCRNRDGEYRWLETLSRPVHDHSGELKHWQSTSRDVTETVMIRQQLAHDTLHDALTGLANRTLLFERLAFALERLHSYPDYGFALLCIDLDRFKVINDSLGHGSGDLIIAEVAQRLNDVVRGTDLVARTGGDEFVLLLDRVRTVEDAQIVVTQIFVAMGTSFQMEGRAIRVDLSMGLVQGERRYHQPSELLRDGDIALYQAKAAGGNCHRVFDPSMHEAATRRLTLENELRVALVEQQFVLYYQPMVCLRSGNLRGFEALVRWQHPQRGVVSPGEFIPLLEEINLINELGQWVLAQACQEFQEWRQAGADPRLSLSVNLAAGQLTGENFLSHLDAVLSQTGLAGECLVLEITETALVQDLHNARQCLLGLQQRGVRVSIDDFGTGYSSFYYLHALPLSTLKIDQSFVARLGEDQRQRHIIEAIVLMAKHLGLKTVAEGVETPEQRAQLRELGCEWGQGYLYDRPMPAAEVRRLLFLPGGETVSS